MISYDNDSIPTKTDSTDAPTIAVDGATILTTNGQIEMTDTTDATTGLVSGLPISGKDDGGQTTSTSSASSTIPTQRLTNRIFNTIQFQQRTKYLRDVWAQHIASLNKDFSQFFVVILVCVMSIAFSIAAILTIVGYSLNETVVVLDRIREVMRKYKKLSTAEIVDMSVNAVLPRTIMTATTVFLALLSLVLFGGHVIRSFSIAMLWGLFVATYSSVFICSPILIYLGVRTDTQRAADEAADPKSAAQTTA